MKIKITNDKAWVVINDKQKCNQVMDALKKEPGLCDNQQTPRECINRALFDPDKELDDENLDNYQKLTEQYNKLTAPGNGQYNVREMQTISKKLRVVESYLRSRGLLEDGGKSKSKSNPIKSRKQKKAKRASQTKKQKKAKRNTRKHKR
jgi:hypothetical protein